jgi:hypothetical protein
MNTELVSEQWAPYRGLVPDARIREALLLPQGVMDEQIEAIVPNIVLGTDGPVVESIIFFSTTYIGEARLVDREEHFDIGLKDSVANYRLQIGRHEIVRNTAAIDAAKAKGEQPPEPEKIVYQKAVLTLQHTRVGLVSTINYFGDNRDAWLESVKANVPVEVLKRSSGN